MLPFELSLSLSVWDIVLLGLMTIMIIMLLRISRNLEKHTLPLEHTTPSILSTSVKPTYSHENLKTLKEADREVAKPESLKGQESSSPSTRCPHYFGYLKTVPDQSSVPNYCYDCPSIMHCLFATEEQIERAKAIQ